MLKELRRGANSGGTTTTAAAAAAAAVETESGYPCPKERERKAGAAPLEKTSGLERTATFFLSVSRNSISLAVNAYNIPSRARSQASNLRAQMAFLRGQERG